MPKKGLTWYLNKYYDLQEKILLVHRVSTNDTWADRCLFLADDYSPTIDYNHRCILQNEIVCEYDDEDKEINRTLALIYAQRLRKDGFRVAVWHSGNKSVHVHTFIDTGNCSNVPLFKKVFLRHYGTFWIDKRTGKIYTGKEDDIDKTIYRKILPDLQLTGSTLIRTEHGLHEKTQKKKTLIKSCASYPYPMPVQKIIWDKYVATQSKIIRAMATRQIGGLEQYQGFKFLLSTQDFRECEDGRERALFILIHILKPKYSSMKELIKFCQEWYRYSGGIKMTETQISHKVKYHWFKKYSIGKAHIDDLLESLGREDLIKRFK